MRLFALSLYACSLFGQATHINAGALDDRYYAGGWTYAYPAALTLPTMRYGNFSYAVPLSPGDYTVSLTFIERIVTSPGAHVFSVAANGAPAIASLDIFAEAGSGTPLVKSFPVTVASSPLTLVFATITRNASVNAIDIAPVVTPPPAIPGALIPYVSPIVNGPVGSFTVPGAVHKLLGMQCRTIGVRVYAAVPFTRPDGTPGEAFERVKDDEFDWWVDGRSCDVTVVFSSPRENFYLTLYGMPM